MALTLGKVFEPFIAQRPICVMARGVLENLCNAERIDTRKTLRLPRCLRRGSLRAFGRGLNAPCQRQVVGVQWCYGPPTYTPCRLRYVVPPGLVAQIPTGCVAR